MTSTNDKEKRPLGVTGDTDGHLVNTLRASKTKEHFPYDCPHAHCTSVTERCNSTECKERLRVRFASLDHAYLEISTVYREVSDEIEALRQQVADSWGDAFTFEADNEGMDWFSSRLCKSSECISCRLEATTLQNAALRMELAMCREQLQALKGYRETRLADEETARTRRSEALKALYDPRLEGKKEEILGLEDQIKMLQLDDDSSKRSAGRSFWKLVDDVEKDGPCTCTSCLTRERSSRIATVMEEAETYKMCLNRLLGIDGSGKSTLERERERIREIAQRDSPFGRVGSYRGFGAGALKPRTGTATNSQPQKTKKKTKKPGLTW